MSARPPRPEHQAPRRASLSVAHVINNLPVGGAERYLLQLAAAQARLGLDVHVLTLVEPNPLAEELQARGIPHTCMRRRRLNDPRLVLDLGRSLRALRPDVAHTHLFYADTFGRLAARLAGVPAIVSTEHSTEGGPLSRRRRAGMRATAPLAARIVAVSEAVRQRAAARLGAGGSRFSVIPNGIELEPWSRVEALPRRDLGLADEALIVGAVGRLVESKGYDALLRAVASLGDPALRLVVVGDGPARNDLEGIARDLDIAAAVTWLGWRDDVPRLLKMFDVFALPSRYEGHSMSLLEAMAAGCACLVSDIPEIAETVGTATLRVAVGSAEALASALRQLAASPELRLRLGERARAEVQRFSIEASAESYLALYEAVLAARCPA